LASTPDGVLVRRLMQPGKEGNGGRQEKADPLGRAEGRF
jgi:hypothetical protein